MRNKIDPEIIKTMEDGTREQRKYICARLPEYFAFFYFPEYFNYEVAPFHWDFFSDFEKLMKGELDEAAWIAFRESAKTTIAKIMVCHAICHSLKFYINWDAYDKENAEAALFDIASWLLTNRRLINDYGSLYKKKKKKKGEEGEDDPSRKRLASFVTENHIKVEAFSTQQSTRGRVYQDKRPDMFVLDDIETSKTKDSFPVITKIIAHVNEMRAGLGVTGCVLYLGNYLTEEGVIAYLEGIITNNPTKKYRKIAVIENGLPSWPGKYVLTNRDALMHNIDKPRKDWKVSLEKKKEDLTPPIFETEMMNNPGASGDYYFDRNVIRGLIAKCKMSAYEPISNKGGFKLFMNYNSSHRYALGADTAEGTGGDSNASCLIDFTTKPMKQIGSYKNNQEGPNIFGYTLKKQGDEFGGCYIVPELNNTGYGTLATLIGEKYYNMYVREVKNKTTDKMQKEYGFKTTDSTKPEILAQLKSAVEDGSLEIMDIDLLMEMYHYTKAHLRMRKKEDGMTRHFDLLMAACLAWEGRNFATLSKDERKVLYTAPKPRE